MEIHIYKSTLNSKYQMYDTSHAKKAYVGNCLCCMFMYKLIIALSIQKKRLSNESITLNTM